MCGSFCLFLEKLTAAILDIPPRIQYCSQEIVVIREDLVNKMCRNCIRLPNNNIDIPNHVSIASLSKFSYMCIIL